MPGAGAAFLPSTLGILTHPKVWEETLWACVVWVGGAWTPASPISAGRFGGPPSQREAWAAVPPWAMREQVARRGQKARPLSTQVPGNTWEAGISRGGEGGGWCWRPVWEQPCFRAPLPTCGVSQAPMYTEWRVPATVAVCAGMGKTVRDWAFLAPALGAWFSGSRSSSSFPQTCRRGWGRSRPPGWVPKEGPSSPPGSGSLIPASGSCVVGRLLLFLAQRIPAQSRP